MTSAGDPAALLSNLVAQPLAFFLAVVALTFLLEDATALAAGALAHQMRVDPILALSAVLLGTIAGDLLLHGAGRLASRHMVIARRLPSGGRLEKAGRSIWLVIMARFVPGLRLPAYAGSGVARMPFMVFLAVVAVTGMVWTPLLFWAGGLVSGTWILLALGAAFLILPPAFAAIRRRTAH